MVVKSVLKLVAQSVILTLITLALLSVGTAQVMTSPSYSLQSDSVNLGGGFSSSTSYIQESTVGEIASGPSDSSSYSLRAGYQQMQEVFLSLAVSGDVVMSPNLPGLTGGTSNGSTTFTVITDSPSGYSLSIAAENSPAMQSGANTIADYNAGTDPDYTFLTGSTDAHLGFSPEGVDVVQDFLDDGVGVCNTGSTNTPLACWEGLSITETPFASGVGSNHPDGATTTLNFRVGIGSSAGVEAGVYIATTTVTALPL